MENRYNGDSERVLSPEEIRYNKVVGLKYKLTFSNYMLTILFKKILNLSCNKKVN